MKSPQIIASLLIAASTFALPASAKGPTPTSGQAATALRTVAVAPITAEDAADLLWMREEEKLARDVYLELYKVWKAPVFKRIATSEQRHFDALGTKLRQFGLADPALPGVGQFSNVELQTLYGQLLGAGSVSYIEALRVGASIEDIDIADFLAAMDATDQATLERTYQNLLDGSKNHLRSFVGLLRDLNSDYTPQYIDALLFDNILGD